MNQCSAIRANGDRCRATALPNRPQCFAHDPENRERATAARRKGGTNRSTPARASRRIPKDMRDLASRLMEAISQVHGGELDPKRLTAMASGAGAVVRLHEVGEIEQRLEALEARAEAGPGRRWAP